MSAELLNPRDCLQFATPFRSLMTACEVEGRSEGMGAEAFEIRQEHMLPWLERNGPETARSIDAHLTTLIARLKQRKTGTVWSGEFDFNHRWSMTDAATYFELWRSKLAEAAEHFEAKTIVLLSLIQRVGEDRPPDRDDLGDIRTVDLSEREFAVLAPRDAVRDRERWVFVENLFRSDDGPQATLCWPSLHCESCEAELEVARDEDDPNDQWRVQCCEEVALGNSIAEVTINWNQWQGRFQRSFRHG